VPHSEERTECKTGTSQKLPLAVNTMIELKCKTATYDNTGTLLCRIQLFYIYMSSIVVHSVSNTLRKVFASN